MSSEPEVRVQKSSYPGLFIHETVKTENGKGYKFAEKSHDKYHGVTKFNIKTGIQEKSKLLGKPNKGWIKSITTLSTPHDGTTISDFINAGIPFLQNFIALAGVAGNSF